MSSTGCKYHIIDKKTEVLSADRINENTIAIDEDIKSQAKQITELSGPYVIPEGTDLPIKDRKKGKMYFKVTSKQSGGVANDTVKVSPMMGLKIQ